MGKFGLFKSGGKDKGSQNTTESQFPTFVDRDNLVKGWLELPCFSKDEAIAALKEGGGRGVGTFCFRDGSTGGKVLSVMLTQQEVGHFRIQQIKGTGRIHLLDMDTVESQSFTNIYEALGYLQENPINKQLQVFITNAIPLPLAAKSKSGKAPHQPSPSPRSLTSQISTTATTTATVTPKQTQPQPQPRPRQATNNNNTTTTTTTTKTTGANTWFDDSDDEN